MLLDRVTEMVAHMFGHFHTNLEEARMRDVYDKFKDLQAANQEIEALKATDITFSSKYSLGDFSPDINYADMGPITPEAHFSPPFFYDIILNFFNIPLFVAKTSSNISIDAQLWGGGRVVFNLEPPSSVAIITYQSAYLEDNDLHFTNGSALSFTDPSVYLAELQQYEMIAATITAPLDADMVTVGTSATDDAIALWNQVSAVEANSLTDVSSTLVRGSDTTGMHLNGQSAEEIPALEDVLPAYMTNSEDEETASETTPVSEDNPETDKDPYEWPDAFEGLNSDNGSDDPEYENGHALVTGANTLVNQVSIGTAWLDASVISVMGDVVNLDVISQFNLLVDRDTGGFGEQAASASINATAMSFSSSIAVPETTDEDIDDATGGNEGSDDVVLPSTWAITHIEGDLININQVVQYTFQTDTDIADVSFSNASTQISMGDNTVTNYTSLIEMGYGYDLIIIGGSMISVNWITQTNVLIDNDTMSYSGFEPTTMSGSDNLLFNGAEINGVGLDTYGEMQENFANAAEDLAEDATSNIDESVAHDSLFEGFEILRVLYIDGDFTSVNWLEQTNVLGDSDQVNLALEEFQAATQAEINVTAGSNALINLASINDYGVDSNVLVGGEVYTDALLHQAEFIDTDANPLGVNMPALASEAVAFLADDMMSLNVEPMEAPIIATTPESTTSPDLMQTMLA